MKGKIWLNLDSLGVTVLACFILTCLLHVSIAVSYSVSLFFILAIRYLSSIRSYVISRIKCTYRKRVFKTRLCYLPLKLV